MTAPFDGFPQPEGGGGQWAECGVNVGRNVYGGIHIHPVAPADGPPRQGHEQVGPVSAARHASVLSGLITLARACERAAEAMSVIGGTRPDRRQR